MRTKPRPVLEPWRPGVPVPEGYHEVRSHIARNPGKARPGWLAFETRSFRFLRRLGAPVGRYGSPADWTHPRDYTAGRFFLKRELMKTYKEEYALGEISWVYVGPNGEWSMKRGRS